MEKQNNTFLIVLLTIFIMLTLGLGVYIIYDKILKEDSKPITSESINNESEENEKKEQTKLSFEVYETTSASDDDYIKSASITILSENEMILSAGDGMAAIENSKGTYEINGSTLLYTRKYIQSYDDNDNLVWITCNQTDLYSENSCSDFGEKTEEFIIKDAKTILGKDGGNYSGVVFEAW